MVTVPVCTHRLCGLRLRLQVERVTGDPPSVVVPVAMLVREPEPAQPRSHRDVSLTRREPSREATNLRGTPGYLHAPVPLGSTGGASTLPPIVRAEPPSHPATT